MNVSTENLTANIILLSTISILFLISIMILLYVFFINKKSSLLLEKQLREKQFEKELTTTQIEIKEETLNYIGQELHDDIGQKLTVARIQTNQLIAKLQDNRKEELSEINDIIKQCIEDVRNLSKTLSSSHIEHFGIVDSLEREIQRVKKLSYLTVDFSCNNNDIDMDGRHALILFRIVQECINNALKHSKTKYLQLVIADADDSLSICIKDKGKGFDTQKPHEGRGMKNIISRANLIGSDINIHSQENKGTTIDLKYYKK